MVYTALGLGYEILCILAAVIIHELAHTLVAGILGIKISEVELLPFGGQARTEDFLGLVPEREVYIALAGPLTSLALAGGVLVAGKHGGEGYLPFFMQINLVLALFNLLPALPLDGGRVLRALLSRRFGYRKATRGAAFLGQIIAVALMGYGAYEAYFLREGVNALVIGAFYSGLLARKLAFWPMLSCVTWYIRRVNYRVRFLACLSGNKYLAYTGKRSA